MGTRPVPWCVKMPCVLWGVACFSLPGPTTTDAVVREFRQALSLHCRHGAPSLGKCDGASSSSISSSSAASGVTNGGPASELSAPRVDLYRLVPITENPACVLAGEERVVAHVPDSSFNCSEIEEVYRQRDEAEIRYDRARESLVIMMEGADSGEGNAAPSTGGDANSAVTRLRGMPQQEAQQTFQFLRQENKALRYKLTQSESLSQELQETASLLKNELALLAREVAPLCPPQVLPPAVADQAPLVSAPQPGGARSGTGAAASACLWEGASTWGGSSAPGEELLPPSPRREAHAHAQGAQASQGSGSGQGQGDAGKTASGRRAVGGVGAGGLSLAGAAALAGRPTGGGSCTLPIAGSAPSPPAWAAAAAGAPQAMRHTLSGTPTTANAGGFGLSVGPAAVVAAAAQHAASVAAAAAASRRVTVPTLAGLGANNVTGGARSPRPADTARGPGSSGSTAPGVGQWSHAASGRDLRAGVLGSNGIRSPRANASARLGGYDGGSLGASPTSAGAGSTSAGNGHWPSHSASARDVRGGATTLRPGSGMR